MKRLVLALIFFALMPTVVPAQSSGAGSDYYVTAGTLNVRAAPRTGQVVNRVYRRQLLTVYETRDGWGRVTAPGFTPAWVSMQYLSKTRPPRPRDTTVRPRDARIAERAIPRPGEHGLTKRDVDVLWRGAMHMLRTGRCSRIDYGDKSVNRAGTYYVNCGGPRNVFFTEQDIRG